MNDPFTSLGETGQPPVPPALPGSYVVYQPRSPEIDKAQARAIDAATKRANLWYRILCVVPSIAIGIGIGWLIWAGPNL